MIIVTLQNKISLFALNKMAEKMFGNLIKAVVDTKRQIMAVDGELHSDEELLLVENGSKRTHVWGINIYPKLKGEDFIEFDSMINLKPAEGNRSRGVENPKIRKKIINIVNKLITKT
jgi:hypothetical protein